MSSPLMTFHIIIERAGINELKAPNGAAVMIPFGGYTESEHFKGKILPGACDVQTVNAAQIRHMCAKYMFEGIDAEGRRCRLFVENNGYFEPMSRPEVFHACPSFLSDSPYLSELLSKPVYRSEGHGTASGVDILIFDVTKESQSEMQEEEKVVLDPYIEELCKREKDEKILEEAKRICGTQKVSQLIFFSNHESNTYVIDEPDERVIAAVLAAVRGTPQMAFMINEKNELAAVSFIAGRIRNIDDMALTVFAEIFRETGGAKYFDRPVNRYARWRINEI